MKNKIQKPVDPSRTIADLKFDWEIIYKAHLDVLEAQSKILKKNPHLAGLTIKPDKYKFFLPENNDFVLVNSNTTNLCTVVQFFEFLCWRANDIISGHFSHFERIDDQTYRIHMKK